MKKGQAYNVLFRIGGRSMHGFKQKKKNQLLIILLVVGFLFGIIYENIISRRQIVTTEIFLASNLQRYLHTDVIAEKYFLYVIKSRIIPLILICVLSCVQWKKLLVTLYLVIIGFFTGSFCVSSVLQLGIKGIFLCLAGLFPQALFYGFMYGILFTHWFYYPERQWNRTKTVFTIVLFVFGILLEIYVNPIIVKFVIGIL